MASLLVLIAGASSDAVAQTDKNQMIVAAFGTSLTYRSGWLKPLQIRLTECLGRPVSVLDFGAGGMTSDWGVLTVGEVTQSQPDVVLIEFSMNDSAWFKGFSLQRSRENIVKIVHTITAARPNARIFLMTMNPTFGPHGWIRMSLNAYYDLYKQLAEQLNVGFIDHRPQWNALATDELKAAIPDGLHPLPEIAGRILVPTIARAIGGAACQ